MSENPSAERFVKALEAHRSPEEAKKYLRYFKTGEGEYGEAGTDAVRHRIERRGLMWGS